jgi:hypothetical protein
MNRRTNVAIAIATFTLLATACATREPIRGQKVDGLDRKLSTFAYIEEGDLITLIVDSWAARDRDPHAYMPLEISVANTGLKSLTLSRESFTLIDKLGNRYPMATPAELIAGYEFLDFDRNLAEIEGIVTSRYSAFTRFDSNFSPQRAATGVVVDRTHVPRFGYVIDFIYFPKPVTGILGQQFELFLDAPQLEDPVFVRFEVR